ncbi:MAG: sulfatase-like hydrolase/transferase [Acidobacteriia bacterium]|nr:sulfatase-like hydrolase/transferase [Terriglobia bacterium]
MNRPTIAETLRAAPVARALVLLGLLAIGSAGCSRESATSPAPVSAASADRRPSILLVTIDTWRSDALGLSGSGRVATPRLDALAQGGVYVRKVQTACPLTTPAHTTILTGLVPHRHGVRDNLHYRLKPGVPTLATILSGAGYHTAAVVAGAPLRKVYGLDRGFATYDDSGLQAEGDEAFVPSQHPADVSTDRALSVLASLPAAPAFLWVHYYDPHVPYAPPEPYRSRYASSPYAGEVAFVDEQVGRLLDGLPRGGGRVWTVLVTGDHGEGLGEHGEETHGVALYEPTLEVPLLLHPRPAGFRDPSGHVGLVDVLPTLCHVAGVSAPTTDGVDLAAGDVPRLRILASEAAYAATSFRLNPVLSLRRGDLIWFHHGVDEVYDVAADPDERSDLSATARGTTFLKELSPVLAKYFGEDPAADIAGRTLEVAPEQLQALRSLGYVGGGGGTGPLRTMDIRRFLPDLNAFNDARDRIVRKDGAGARGALRELLGRYPDSNLVWRELGSACLLLSDRPGAEEAFGKALSLEPADAVSALNLGNLRAMAGDNSGAERLYLRSLAAEEQQAEAHLNLGLLYARVLNRPADAIPHLGRFLELTPSDREAPAVRALLARLTTAAPR